MERFYFVIYFFFNHLYEGISVLLLKGTGIMDQMQGQIQESEYQFPYHYLPSLKNGIPSIRQFLGWGWEYLTYMDFLISEIIRLKPRSVLDVGCGDGYMINQLCALNYDGQLGGVDTSERAITFAKAFCSRPKHVFQAEDIFKMSEQSELVSMIEVIEHIPDVIVDGFIQQAFALSSKYVLISVPTTAFPLQKKHYRHYDEALLARQTEFAEGDFELVKTVRLYNETKCLKFLKRLLENKFFAINYKPLLAKLWAFHLKNTYFANTKNGFHLIALYQRKA
jgi:2-polyprenyl-3-methyl-5-hydroxy-6-metoxy-1,4-benzoquinol methylase